MILDVRSVAMLRVLNIYIYIYIYIYIERERERVGTYVLLKDNLKMSSKGRNMLLCNIAIQYILTYFCLTTYPFQSMYLLSTTH